MYRKISIVSAVLGAVLAVTAAVVILIQQAGILGISIFPLPFLVFVDWATLGIAGAVYVNLSTIHSDAHQLQGAWAVLGAYIPLIVLGAFSIGPIALVGGLLLLAPTIHLTIRYGGNFRRLLGILVIGGLVNLIVLVALIMIGQLAR
jgi:hypothetical protein